MMLNYFNFERFHQDCILITNDFGRFAFLTDNQFKTFVLEAEKSSKGMEDTASLGDGEIQKQQELREKLKKKLFFMSREEALLKSDLPDFLRDMKGYLFSSTSLHIFVMTNVCNMACVYCQAQDRASKMSGFMCAETGKKAVDLAFQSPSRSLTFEFQGGEPLLNFDIVREIVLYSEKTKGKRDVLYTMVSNLILLDEEKIGFLREHQVHVSTSLDGPKALHDKNRIIRKGGSSYDVVTFGIRKLREAGIFSGAIETTTRYSLEHPREIIDAYLENGMHEIFLRPLTPLGMAANDWEKIGYSIDEYLVFYREAFRYILELNKRGVFFRELFSVYFLKKILRHYAENYMELRSPCGGAIGQMAYYYDGSIYTCDEGRMISESGDRSFCLGDVDDDYDMLMTSPVCRTLISASIVECLPGCETCVFQPYCGVCPIVTYKMEQNIIPQSSHGYKCALHYGTMKMLFEYIRENREGELELFKRWIEE